MRTLDTTTSFRAIDRSSLVHAAVKLHAFWRSVARSGRREQLDLMGVREADEGVLADSLVRMKTTDPARKPQAVFLGPTDPSTGRR